MIKTKLIVTAGFVVAFGAGAISGVVTQRSASGTAAVAQKAGGDPSHGRGRRPLSELNLTPDQEKQMGAVWSEVMKHRHDHDEAFRKLRKDRSDAVAAMMENHQDLKPAYDAIQNDFKAKQDALDQEWKKLTDAAVAKTRAILTSEQWVKYEQIRTRRESEGRGRAPGPRPEERATSRPAN